MIYESAGISGCCCLLSRYGGSGAETSVTNFSDLQIISTLMIRITVKTTYDSAINNTPNCLMKEELPTMKLGAFCTFPDTKYQSSFISEHLDFFFKKYPTLSPYFKDLPGHLFPCMECFRSSNGFTQSHSKIKGVVL